MGKEKRRSYLSEQEDRRKNVICVDANYKRNYLNKDIKQDDFEKDLMNLIETNHQINMTSDHSGSSNNSFKGALM